MKLLVVCIVLHWALANLWPAPWWLPDLTLAGLVVAIVNAPHRWAAPSLAAAAATAVWTVRDTGLIFLSLLAGGWAVRVCAEQWDLSDPRAKAVLAAAAAAVLQGVVLWRHGWWSWPLAGMWLIHAGVTGAAAGIIGSLAAERRAPSSLA